MPMFLADEVLQHREHEGAHTAFFFARGLNGIVREETLKKDLRHVFRIVR